MKEEGTETPEEMTKGGLPLYIYIYRWEGHCLIPPGCDGTICAILEPLMSGIDTAAASVAA